MLKDGAFEMNKVTQKNLDLLFDKQLKNEEQRISEISELVDLALADIVGMTEDGYGIYEILSVLGESVSSELNFGFNPIIEKNRPKLIAYSSLISAFDKAVFSSFFVERAEGYGLSVAESDFLFEGNGNSLIVYSKNPLADEAYDVFSQGFKDARVKYADTLKNAVRAVSSDDAEYCILPLEERGGVRLATVAGYIFKEDLKIASVTPVFGFDGLSDMKYALLSKHFIIPNVNIDDDRYFEIRLDASAAVALSELFTVADILGVDIYRMNTIVFDTEDGEKLYYSVVFKTEGRNFSAILVYLTLFAGNYTAVGIYKNLE